jgi:hypothetical protein
MEEFLRSPKIAADFAAYYQLYQKYMGQYRIPELLSGRLSDAEEEQLLNGLQNASGEVHCMLVRHLLASAGEELTELGRMQRYVLRKQEVVKQLKDNDKTTFLKQRAHAFQVRKEHGLLKPWEEAVEQKIDEELLADMEEVPIEALENRHQQVQAHLEQGAAFLEKAFGKGAELEDYLAGLTAHGDFTFCNLQVPGAGQAGERKELELQLRKEIKELEELYETTDRI